MDVDYAVANVVTSTRVLAIPLADLIKEPPGWWERPVPLTFDSHFG